MSSSSSIQEYLIYSPFNAALHGRSLIEQRVLIERFTTMSDSVRELLAGDECAQTLKEWETTGVVPTGYGPAIAKLLGLVAFSEVNINAVHDICLKIGIPNTQIPSILEALQPFLSLVQNHNAEPQSPLIAPSSTPEPSFTMAPLPPLTTSKSVPVPPPPNRTTIDLRDKKLMP